MGKSTVDACAKFGLRDKLAYAAGDFGCNMSFALKGYLTIYWTQFMGMILKSKEWKNGETSDKIIESPPFACAMGGLSFFQLIRIAIISAQGITKPNPKKNSRSSTNFQSRTAGEQKFMERVTEAPISPQCR